jgi:glycosyltransferase involved in cell wall biosynthesis
MYELSTPRISAVIIARDEAKQLAGCLSTLGWVDEVIVVVDEATRDETEAIARRRADRVIVRRFESFSRQRNAGMALASGEWVFSIDADERVSGALATEIRRSISYTHHAGFRIPIRSHILRRAFSHSGTQMDRPVRLFRRSVGRWTGLVHERVEVGGSIGELRHALDHQTLETIDVFLRKLDRYTTLEASQLFGAGVKYRARGLWLRPAWVFLKLYFARSGYRDGMEGFVFCALSAVSAGVREFKLRELEHARAGEWDRLNWDALRIDAPEIARPKLNSASDLQRRRV